VLGFAIDLAHGFHHADAAQALPLVSIGEPADLGALPVAASLQPPVAFVEVRAGGQFRTVAGDGFIQVALDFGVREALIAFEREDVIGVRLDDFLGDLPLAAHGVEGHDAAASLQRAQEARR
jgi:hypothetical protein